MGSPLERLRAVFGPKRAGLRHTIAWVLSEGEAFWMDARSAALFTPGWRRDCDLTVLTNAATLDALLAGELAPAHPSPGQLFLWGGDPDALESLGASLRGLSPLGLRAARGAAR